MSKYKFRNFYKILLYYYFLNAIKVHKCDTQMSEDVEFVIPPKVDKNDVSELPSHTDESDFYEPYKPIEPSFGFDDDDIDESKKVNLNVNNNLHESESVPRTESDDQPFTEISELQISGEKTLRLSESPYVLRQDLEIMQSARLNIQPGVHIHFVPMVGITVHGQLRAIVSRAITMFLSYLISARASKCGNKCSYPNNARTLRKFMLLFDWNALVLSRFT
jgi:hypothetical protein